MPFNSETASEAGKKSKRGVSERLKLLNDLLKEENAKEVFNQLESKALAGDMDAIKTYLAYCFGKPEGKIDFTSDGESIILNAFRAKENEKVSGVNGNGVELLNGNGKDH